MLRDWPSHVLEDRGQEVCEEGYRWAQGVRPCAYPRAVGTRLVQAQLYSPACKMTSGQGEDASELQGRQRAGVKQVGAGQCAQVIEPSTVCAPMERGFTRRSERVHAQARCAVHPARRVKEAESSARQRWIPTPMFTASSLTLQKAGQRDPSGSSEEAV